MRGHDCARASHAVLPFDAMPLAQSSRSGLLQDHVHSACSRPTIVGAGRVVLTHSTRNSAGVPAVRNLSLFARDHGGSSRSSVPRFTSAPSSTHLALPPVGLRLSHTCARGNSHFVLEERCDISALLCSLKIGALVVGCVRFGLKGSGPRCCAGDSAAFVSWWRTYFVQLNLHHAWPHAAVSQHPFNGSSHVCA